MSAFERACTLVIGTEGGFTSNPADPGNWTGGACGRGECRGTKFGISAAAYPGENISILTIETASAIYRRDYWDKLSGDQLPPPLALLAFDAAVNNGVRRAIGWLQKAARVDADGVIGPDTLAAIRTAASRPGGGASLCAEMLAERLTFMVSLPSWRTFGGGWARRLTKLPFDCVTMTGD